MKKLLIFVIVFLAIGVALVGIFLRQIGKEMHHVHESAEHLRLVLQYHDPIEHGHARLDSTSTGYAIPAPVDAQQYQCLLDTIAAVLWKIIPGPVPWRDSIRLFDQIPHPDRGHTEFGVSGRHNEFLHCNVSALCDIRGCARDIDQVVYGLGHEYGHVLASRYPIVYQEFMDTFSILPKKLEIFVMGLSEVADKGEMDDAEAVEILKAYMGKHYVTHYAAIGGVSEDWAESFMALVLLPGEAQRLPQVIQLMSYPEIVHEANLVRSRIYAHYGFVDWQQDMVDRGFTEEED